MTKYKLSVCSRSGLTRWFATGSALCLWMMENEKRTISALLTRRIYSVQKNIKMSTATSFTAFLKHTSPHGVWKLSERLHLPPLLSIK